jgi:choline monooxygenase
MGPLSTGLDAKLRAFDPSLPLERARTIPAAWYFDPDIYAAECRSVFGGSWQVAGRSEQVVAPGSFVATDIAGEPVVVVRGEDSVLRGFHNVCRHRAARVVEETEGKASRFRCRYHGWTYDLTGRLRGTPEFDGVLDFCKEAEGLPEVAVAEWGPLVFVNLGDQRIPLEQYLAPLHQRAGEMGLDRLRFVERRTYRLACNWKIAVDNYVDGGYHLATVHPGLSNVLDYSQYRTEVFENASLQMSPIQASESSSLSAVRSGTNAYYWWVFPNFMMNVYEGIMDTNLVLPLGPDACMVIFDFYFADVDLPGRRALISESIAVSERIQQEDIDVCEDVQRGLRSRSFETGRYSVKREAGVHHFHKLLARSLRGDRPALR